MMTMRSVLLLLLVSKAAAVFVVGTGVYQSFPTGWFYGEVTAYDIQEQTYSVGWEDANIDVDRFEEGDIFQFHRNFSYLFSVGENVKKEFDNGKWKQGKVSDISNQEEVDKYAATYTITWSDGTETISDSDEMVTIVDNFLEKDGDVITHGIGDKVYRPNGDSWKTGEITGFKSGDALDAGYTITWEDGSVQVGFYTDFEVDNMVNMYNERYAHKIIGEQASDLEPAKEAGKEGTQRLLTIFIVLLSIASIGVAGYCIMNRVARLRRFRGSSPANHVAANQGAATDSFSMT